MKKWLSLALTLERDLIVGGQAVIEGVMMRTPSAYAIAVRRSDGSIIHTAEKLPKWSDTYPVLNYPVLRGGATLVQSMILGVKALNFSANIFEEDLEAQEEKVKQEKLATEPALAEGTTDENFTKARATVTMPQKSEAKSESKSKPKQSMGAVGSIIFALLFNILLFIVAPLLLTNLGFIWLGWAEAPAIAADAGWWGTVKAYIWEIKPHSWIAFNLIDGLIRMAFFVVMIFSMSFLKDIRRVFEYHGAEHKTVFNWEKGLELTPENARVQSGSTRAAALHF